MNCPPPTARQARVIWFAVSALAVAVIVAVLAGAVWGLGRTLRLLSPVLWPLAVILALFVTALLFRGCFGSLS